MSAMRIDFTTTAGKRPSIPHDAPLKVDISEYYKYACTCVRNAIYKEPYQDWVHDTAVSCLVRSAQMFDESLGVPFKNYLAVKCNFTARRGVRIYIQQLQRKCELEQDIETRIKRASSSTDLAGTFNLDERDCYEEIRRACDDQENMAIDVAMRALRIGVAEKHVGVTRGTLKSRRQAIVKRAREHAGMADDKRHFTARSFD